jgi:hypothetical protein
MKSNLNTNTFEMFLLNSDQFYCKNVSVRVNRSQEVFFD